jgi:hypothetical protein
MKVIEITGMRTIPTYMMCRTAGYLTVVQLERWRSRSEEKDLQVRSAEPGADALFRIPTYVR